MTRRLNIAVPMAVLAAGLAFAEAPPHTPPADSDKQDTTTRSRPRIRFGGFMVNAGFSHFSGPFMFPYYGYPFRPWMWGPYSWNWPMMFDPFLYGPYLHPGFFTGFGYYPSMGEIKLKSADKEAWVYLDGALAGKAEKLKNMWLEPGAYNLEVKSGQKRFSQKVYVLSGKTLRLTADPDRGEVRP
jgi:hypothetical protein